MLNPLSAMTPGHDFFPIVVMKACTAFCGKFRGIDLAPKTPEARFKFGNRHIRGMKINVEQRAKLPRFFAQESFISLEAFIERCPRKGRLDSDLHFVESALLNELPDVFE